MAKVNPEIESFARIKVIGIGGSGKGALNHMINSKLQGVEFVAMNTDTQDLHHSLAEKKIHIGKNLTKGLGAGMDPEIGKRSAEETREEIQDVIKGADMVFIAGGMGGGTGTGAAPVVASVAKSEGILTIGVVTKPFFFEGASRMKLAERGLEELEKEVDALIVIPNDRLLSVIDKNTTVKQAFEMCDEVLKQAVEGISDIIRTAGTINLDFADIKRILKDSGTALMGVGRGMGENRAREAATAAVNSPLLDVSIHGAKGVLFAIYGAEDLGMFEVQEAAKIITESVDKDAKIIFGIATDPTLKKDEIKVTVIATGFPSVFSTRVGQPLVPTHHSEHEEEAPRAVEKETHRTESLRPEPRVEKTETIRETIIEATEDKRIDLEMAEGETKLVEDTKKTTPTASQAKKPVFKFDDEEDEDEWEALPPFLRRKK
jgi:cell division protein FtsZ